MPSDPIYPRNRRFIAAMPVIAVICLLIGVATLAVASVKAAIVWCLMAGLWCANYLLSRKTPFAVLSDEALLLFPSPVLPRKVLPWNQMVRLRLLAGYRCQIYLNNGRRVDFRLFWLDAARRGPFVQTIEAAIARNVAHGAGPDA